MLQLCLLVAFGSDMIGYYSWNWGTGSEGSKGATDAVAFTGLVDVVSTETQLTLASIGLIEEKKKKKKKKQQVDLSVGGALRLQEHMLHPSTSLSLKA